MEFPYRSELIEEAGLHFDAVVAKVTAKDFQIIAPPEPGICKECDLRAYCLTEGTIQ
jgi:CRISPR/Cas system-associated exonuclease Cas4 (RecB family)